MCSRKWLIFAFVVCGLASACSQYNTNLSIQTASSVLTFVSPGSATVGSQGFTITANGSGFTTGALILWNGIQLNTTLVSSIQLTAPVPSSYLTKTGTVFIAVQIPGSAQSATQNIYNTTTTEISDQVPFTINATPGTPPGITSVSVSGAATSAASTPSCSAQGFTLNVVGTNFTSDAIVNWNGSARVTTFVNSTQLTAAITANDTAFPGSASVSVINSAGTSNPLSFTILTPAALLQSPTLSSVTPNAAAAGSPPFALTPLNPITLLPANAIVVTASQGTFLPCTAIQWTDSNNVKTTLPTIYIPAAAEIPATATTPAIPAHPLQLNAALPASELAGAATVQQAKIALVNPAPSGPTVNPSVPVTFTISPPAISTIAASTTSLSSTPSCSAAGFTLTVNGTNFLNTSAVNWVVKINQQTTVTYTLATTFVSATQLTALVPASDIVSTGTVQIQVSNSGALSNQSAFNISPATLSAPTIATVLPATATAGAAGATVTVTGTNIVPCSVVQWTSGTTTTQLPTAYVSATAGNPVALTATIPAGDIASVGTAQLTIASPASSANVSGPFQFNIVLPTVTSLSASTTTANNTPFCSLAGLTLTVNGTGFANGLTVNWNGSPRPTTFVSATQLTAAISAADTAFLATAPAPIAITVSGPYPGTNSNSLPFSMTVLPTGATLPTPVLSSISPTGAATESQTGPAIALTLNGNGLSPCTVANWNGNPLPATIFIGTGGIASFIPAANLSVTGTNQITTVTPGLAGSNSEALSVYTPGSPTVTNVPGASLSLPVLSASQRFGVFVLASTDGITETPGTTQNIFLKDTCLGVASGCTASTALVSAATNGTPGNADSISPSINANSAPSSSDGRYVAFLSAATNLVTGGTNGLMQAYVRDTCAGIASGCTPSTQIVSVTSGTSGTQANAPTLSAVIDATGRYVTFESSATNLGSISSTTIGLFVRDTCLGVASGCTPTTQPLN